MNWKKLWRKTYRTMAQALVGVLPSAGLFWNWDWKPIVSTVIIAGLVCFLSGIADDDNLGFEDEIDDDDEIIEEGEDDVI